MMSSKRMMRLLRACSASAWMESGVYMWRRKADPDCENAAAGRNFIGDEVNSSARAKGKTSVTVHASIRSVAGVRPSSRILPKTTAAAERWTTTRDGTESRNVGNDRQEQQEIQQLSRKAHEPASRDGRAGWSASSGSLSCVDGLLICFCGRPVVSWSRHVT